MCERAIVVQQKKFSDLFNGLPVTPAEGFLVRLINMDINKDQMLPKFMSIVSDDGDSILLKGVSLKVMDTVVPSGDHKDYGLRLVLRNRNVVKAILYMYDRNTEIQYNIG